MNDTNSNNLSEKEVYQILEDINGLSIPEAVKQIWKIGFEWGYTLGEEDGYDNGYAYGQADAGVYNDE